MIEKHSLGASFAKVGYLPHRTPQMALTGEADFAFADIAPYRDGVVAVGHYSGSSEWERHPAGDEIVMAIEGHTTLVVLVDDRRHRVDMAPGEFVVVPRGCWHRFEDSKHLKVLAVTPQPTDHSVDLPGA